MAEDTTVEVDETFRAQALRLPNEPGVYVFHDADDIVLYVGKARSLRKRVLSYLKRDPTDRKTTELVPRVVRIEAVVATSETEALLLEQNFIKRFRPPFNVRMRDDKSYPYISVTVEDEYPRVMFTRERHRRGVRYFGPYSSARAVRSTLETLNKVFPYRPCEGPTPGRRSGVPCLDYHIGRCAAPCVNLISREDYRAVIDQVDHVPRGPHAADRARSRAAHGRGLGGAGVRGGRPSPQPSHLRCAPSRSVSRSTPAARPTTSSRSRSPTAWPTCSSSRFARAGSTSGARSTSRTSAMGIPAS